MSGVGLYKFIFRSKNKQVEAFTDWVCSEVLLSIKKHGAYITKIKAIALFGLIDNDEAERKKKTAAGLRPIAAGNCRIVIYLSSDKTDCGC
jgi:prophage antirepressor-like protein